MTEKTNKDRFEEWLAKPPPKAKSKAKPAKPQPVVRKREAVVKGQRVPFHAREVLPGDPRGKVWAEPPAVVVEDPAWVSPWAGRRRPPVIPGAEERFFRSLDGLPENLVTTEYNPFNR